MNSLRETVAFGLAMLAAIAVIEHCTGCKPVGQHIENAAAVAQYERLLDHCKALGKDAGSYAVYERCADEVDRELCENHGLMCTDGGR